MRYQVASRSFIIGIALVLCSLPALAQDAPDPTGTWDVQVDMGGTPMAGTLNVVKNDDGTYSGTLKTPMGELSLQNVDYVPGETISFAETIGEGDQAISFKFEGKFTGPDSFKGQLESETMGVMDVTGMRAKAESPMAGIWDVTSESQLGTLHRKLIVYKNGSGKYVGDTAWKISDLNVDGNNVTFDVTVSAGGQELPLTFKGTQEDGTLTGNFLMDGSEVAQVSGTRTSTGDLSVVYGSWDLSADTPLGPFEAKVEIPEGGEPKLISEEGESPIENLDMDADMLNFDATVNFEGETYDVTFEGTVDGNTIGGDFIMGGAPVATVAMTRTDA